MVGLTRAQRYNKRMDQIFSNARRLGAIDDKVTCTKCGKVLRKRETDMMGRCKRCRI